METFAFVLSLFGTVCACVPQLLKGKNMKLILLFLFTANAAVGISYILTGALNGGISCLIGAAQAIINYFFERKGRSLPAWLIAVYAVVFTAANILVFTSATDILAVIACLVYIGAICQKNGKAYRLWSLVNTGLWVAYDIINASYGPLVTHGVMLSIILFGIVIHDIRAPKEKAE